MAQQFEEGTSGRQEKKVRRGHRENGKRAERGAPGVEPFMVEETFSAEVEGLTPAQASITQLATEMLAHTSFSGWAVAGAGSFLYLGDHKVILGQESADNGVKALFVQVSQNPQFYVGDHVFMDELRVRAADGERVYIPDPGKNPDNEEARRLLFGALLEKIAAEGGHVTVLQKVAQLRKAAQSIQASEPLTMH